MSMMVFAMQMKISSRMAVPASRMMSKSDLLLHYMHQEEEEDFA